MTAQNQPDSQLGDERKKALMVQEILALPVRENSSALKNMDAWAIANYAERLAASREAQARLDETEIHNKACATMTFSEYEKFCDDRKVALTAALTKEKQ